jgi:hypothetical protein
MMLEEWSVDHYQLPQLDIQSIRRREDALEVDSRRGRFRLACRDAELFDLEILPMLHALRDPLSTLWAAVRRYATGTAVLIPWLRALDHLGLIRECGPADASRAQAAIDRAVHAWSAELGGELAGDARALAMVEQLVDRLDEPRTRRGAILEDDGFFVVTLLLQARYLRADAPAVLALIVAGLRAAVRRARLGEASAWWFGIGEMPASADEDWSCGLVEPPVVRRYLTAVGRLVREASGPDAARRVRSSRHPVEPLAGINFVLDLEGEMSQLVSKLGPPPRLAPVRTRVQARRLLDAAFLQEYLVTCRFVECVAPLLSRRFAEPLRDAVHRYFAEATGHETFERDYCLRLGFTEQQIDEAEPLPLHLAFVDILTALASESPIALFCASMFTQGSSSTRHALAALAAQALPDEPMLVEAIGDHLISCEDADHRGVARAWMSQVPLVTARVQREVSELISYLAELNWRRWDQVVRSCSERAGGSPS